MAHRNRAVILTAVIGSLVGFTSTAAIAYWWVITSRRELIQRLDALLRRIESLPPGGSQVLSLAAGIRATKLRFSLAQAGWDTSELHTIEWTNSNFVGYLATMSSGHVVSLELCDDTTERPIHAITRLLNSEGNEIPLLPGLAKPGITRHEAQTILAQ